MKYCSHCGVEISIQIPEQDNRERFVCLNCDLIHYENPKIVSGCLPVWEDKVLLCKRAIEPRKGYWTLPAGFMELGETLEQAALRETWEEATANVKIKQLYCVFSLPHVDQVFVMFLSELRDLSFCPGEESEETVLFDESVIPWDELAFSTVKYCLQFYFEERSQHQYTTHVGDIIKTSAGYQYRAGG